MNKIFSILALLIMSLCIQSQTISEPYRLFPKANFRPPTDTVLNPVFVGEIRYRPADGKFYKSISLTGQKWTDMIVFAGSGITDLNGLNNSTQTFATGTTGTDFNVSSTGGTHTFNIPDASATARGFMSTGTQTFAGAKTFNGAMTFAGGASLSGTDVYFGHTQTVNSILLGVEAANAYLMYSLGTRTIQFGTGTTGNIRIRNTGNTIIGEASDNGSKLLVDGAISSSSITGTGNATVQADANGYIVRGHASPYTKIRVVDNVDFTVATDDGTVILKNSSSAINATLSAASSFTNRQFILVNSGTGTIVTSINFRVSGSTTANVIQAGETAVFQSDGTDWWLVGKMSR